MRLYWKSRTIVVILSGQKHLEVAIRMSAPIQAHLKLLLKQPAVLCQPKNISNLKFDSSKMIAHQVCFDLNLSHSKVFFFKFSDWIPIFLYTFQNAKTITPIVMQRWKRDYARMSSTLWIVVPRVKRQMNAVTERIFTSIRRKIIYCIKN